MERVLPPVAVVLAVVLAAAAVVPVLLAAPADARERHGIADPRERHGIADPRERHRLANEPVDIGNGTRNRNIVRLDSPTHNRGHQHTAASTAGGATSVAAGFCRRVRNCDLRQNLSVIVAAPVSDIH